jgi:hypothetical protein
MAIIPLIVTKWIVTNETINALSMGGPSVTLKYMPGFGNDFETESLPECLMARL